MDHSGPKFLGTQSNPTMEIIITIIKKNSMRVRRLERIGNVVVVAYFPQLLVLQTGRLRVQYPMRLFFKFT
jgi:hypothetical protein